MAIVLPLLAVMAVLVVPAASTSLPGSTGGVAVSCAPTGAGRAAHAVFMNSTGRAFVMDVASGQWVHQVGYNTTEQGRPFFCWFPQPEAHPTSFLLMTQKSIVLAFDWSTSVFFTGRLNLQPQIPIGWAGGLAAPPQPRATTAWVTGKYNVVEIDTVGLTVLSVQPILTGSTGGKFEPLCGDVDPAGSTAFFGSCTGGRTSGNGSLTGLSLPVPSGGGMGKQWFLDLGESLHWPFQVFASGGGELVYVFASAGVGVVDLSVRQLVNFVTADPAPLAELMCYNADRTYVVLVVRVAAVTTSLRTTARNLSAEGLSPFAVATCAWRLLAAVLAGTSWQLWDMGPSPKVRAQFGQPSTSSHTCLFSGPSTVFVGGEDVATGTPVITKYEAA